MQARRHPRRQLGQGGVKGRDDRAHASRNVNNYDVVAVELAYSEGGTQLIDGGWFLGSSGARRVRRLGKPVEASSPRAGNQDKHDDKYAPKQPLDGGAVCRF